jgi:polyisoprenoid-binding protein YceI
MATWQILLDGEGTRQRTAAVGDWVLDPGGSRLEFETKTFWGLVTVRGHFSKFDGTARVDEDGSVTTTLAVDAASVDTKMERRDAHLRSAGFLNAPAHPYMTANIGQVTFVGSGTASASGELTVAGRAQPVAFGARVSLPAGTEDAVVEADFEVDHGGFGMTRGFLHMVRPVTRVKAYLVFRHTRTSK